MKKSYIDYAMSVIVSRALPDVRDGLKPVHRRILYTMYEENLTSDKPFRKAATAVGDVMGRYHPHGDQAIYDSLVRMAQPFSLRYMLVDGHGNFGSVDGDPPAAMRYTESRMSKIAMEMMADIEKDTVDFVPNYDNFRKEPSVLPSRFPNLLVNGSSGIAVGMATNIPPHNLSEVIDATVAVIDDSEVTLEDLLQHIKGPDFPTYGTIFGVSGMRAAYATGRGRMKVRAKAEIEEGKTKTRIVVKELPYQVNKARLVESIAELVKDKTVEAISALRDESDRNGMKIVIELKRDANAQIVLNQLYTHTQMQVTFGIILLALVNGQPKVMTLREMLDHYIAHQREVTIRRAEYELKKALERAHILEGLCIAARNVDEVVKIIRASTNIPEAKTALISRFDLSDIQAQAIVDLRLGRLTGLELDKIEAEYAEIMKKIEELRGLLGSESQIMAMVREELLEIKRKYGDERRTDIEIVDDEIDMEDLIERTDCVFTLTSQNYIKRQPEAVYRAQRRGGRGVTAQAIREEDYIKDVLVGNTHDTLLFFTNYGRLYTKKGYHIPESGRNAKGMNIVNLLPLESDERVTAIIPTSDDMAEEYLVLVTRRGVVKRVLLDVLRTNRKSGVRAITLAEGDELNTVRKTDGYTDIIIATRQGKAICFPETDIRTMGREAGGVRGMRLAEGDEVVGAARAHPDGTLLTVTENGYGKRTELSAYRMQKRGGMGVKNHGLNDKTGLVADIKVVSPDDDILLISDDGTIIRIAVDSINVYSRSASGVTVMRMGKGAKLIATARVKREEESDNIEGDSEGSVGHGELDMPQTE
ncbi:MAG: DNA gyrase subunit A [Oscillospiraceae bacterium]|nr:DNA gyrase subunit A [Oscillospiraceae bacterium]